MRAGLENREVPGSWNVEPPFALTKKCLAAPNPPDKTVLEKVTETANRYKEADLDRVAAEDKLKELLRNHPDISEETCEKFFEAEFRCEWAKNSGTPKKRIKSMIEHCEELKVPFKNFSETDFKQLRKVCRSLKHSRERMDEAHTRAHYELGAAMISYPETNFPVYVGAGLITVCKLVRGQQVPF